MEEFVFLFVLFFFVVAFIYPLFVVLSIANLLRKYLKCRIRQMEYELFLISDDDNVQ